MVSVAMEGLDKEKECDREVTGHVLACALTAIGEMAPSIGTPCASILDPADVRRHLASGAPRAPGVRRGSPSAGGGNAE